MKKIVTLFLSLSLVFAVGCGNASVTSIRFGSAAVGGMYSAFANAYTQIVSQDDENLQFSVRSTAGSAANIRLLSDGYIQMAIAQADLTDDAYHGTGDFDKKPLHGYSAVAALYTEACQIVVRADSDIHSVDDLLGKKVSIGEEESGTERNAKQIFEVYGLSNELVDCENLDYTQAAEALVSGKIDAMFCTAGVQTTVIEELTRQCGIRLLSMDETHIQKLMAAYDFYMLYTIPVYTYSGQSEETTTVGVKSLLLVSDELSDKTVEHLTEQLFSHVQDIQYSLPLNLQMDETSATQNVTIPFHVGAAAYYEKQGITVNAE